MTRNPTASTSLSARIVSTHHCAQHLADFCLTVPPKCSSSDLCLFSWHSRKAFTDQSEVASGTLNHLILFYFWKMLSLPSYPVFFLNFLKSLLSPDCKDEDMSSFDHHYIPSTWNGAWHKGYESHLISKWLIWSIWLFLLHTLTLPAWPFPLLTSRLLSPHQWLLSHILDTFLDCFAILACRTFLLFLVT